MKQKQIRGIFLGTRTFIIRPEKKVAHDNVAVLMALY